MKEQIAVTALTHRDLIYESLLLVMSKVDVTVGKDGRFLELYRELESRLACGEELCDKCREKVNVSEMVDA